MRRATPIGYAPSVFDLLPSGAVSWLWKYEQPTFAGVVDATSTKYDPPTPTSKQNIRFSPSTNVLTPPIGSQRSGFGLCVGCGDGAGGLFFSQRR
jgi:hypothetical protein